uniref:ATP synthase complex subunit 8 n=1 Tax=Sphaeroderma testaceum TaxID=428710 RepID=A0A3G1GQP8_9CUCU|nr:ATP synthase F0 subunit 8 [Sphaeroderma testaceum]
MPQMMPLNWFSLMIFFISIFILYNNLNYYNFLYKNMKSNQTMKMYKMTWKW